jgi:hypothetical protein
MPWMVCHVWVQVLPLQGDKGMVDALQHRVSPLIPPSKEVALKMKFFERHFIEEPSELPH